MSYKTLLKRVAAVVLTATMTLSLALCGGTSAEAANYKTYSKSTQLYNLVGTGYNGGEKGPISITKGYMYVGWNLEPVYLITLSGTEPLKNQSTGYFTDLLSGFNLDNMYLENVVKRIKLSCDKGANIVLAGHSLGGMIAQQVAANDFVKSNYNVLYTVCFGSPLLSAGEREGTVKRLGDTSDIVPYASGSIFNNTAWAIAGLNREDGGYGKMKIRLKLQGKNYLEEAHVHSYERDDVWGAYDVLGFKYGNHKLYLDVDSTQYYKAPTNIWDLITMK